MEKLEKINVDEHVFDYEIFRQEYERQKPEIVKLKGIAKELLKNMEALRKKYTYKGPIFGEQTNETELEEEIERLERVLSIDLEDPFQVIFQKDYRGKYMLLKEGEEYFLRGFEKRYHGHDEIVAFSSGMQEGGGHWKLSDGVLRLYEDSEKYEAPKNLKKLKELVNIVPEIPLFKGCKVELNY